MTPSTSTGRDSSTTFLKSLAVVAGLFLSAFLIWSLRSLILPVVVGSLLAYICSPLVVGLERFRLRRGLAIGLLLLAFVSAGVFLVSRVRAGIPDDAGVLELRVRALRNVNRRYQALMGLDPSLARGNRLYRIAHQDLDPLLDRLNRLLALTPEEQARFLSLHTQPANAPDGSDRLQDYHRENLHTLEARAHLASPRLGAGDPAGARNVSAPKKLPPTPLAALGAILSTWVVAPAVFLFLLRDTGEIKRGFLRTVPNRLFEPALAILTDLDRAIGGYVRGVFLESSTLGISVALLLAIVGVPINWAILIGLVSGAANPVPYIGSAVALFGGLAYVLFSDEVHPLLPMIRDENVGLWMVLGVAMIEILKNLLLEPLLLGSTTKLHPLVVLFAVIGGGILFGVVGLLLALPTVTIFKALISSASHQLKAYALI
jgi:predicted PurR-regulated permease PerM